MQNSQSFFAELKTKDFPSPISPSRFNSPMFVVKDWGMTSQSGVSGHRGVFFIGRSVSQSLLSCMTIDGNKSSEKSSDSCKIVNNIVIIILLCSLDLISATNVQKKSRSRLNAIIKKIKKIHFMKSEERVKLFYNNKKKSN